MNYCQLGRLASSSIPSRRLPKRNLSLQLWRRRAQRSRRKLIRLPTNHLGGFRERSISRSSQLKEQLGRRRSRIRAGNLSTVGDHVRKDASVRRNAPERLSAKRRIDIADGIRCVSPSSAIRKGVVRKTIRPPSFLTKQLGREMFSRVH